MKKYHKILFKAVNVSLIIDLRRQIQSLSRNARQSEEPRHKSEKKILKKLRKTKTFISKNFEECQL